MIHPHTVDTIEFPSNVSLTTTMKNSIGQKHLQFNLLHVSQTFDPAMFRKTVQAKIKEKYQNNQSKNNPKRILKTLQINPGQPSDRNKRKIPLNTQSVDKSQKPQEKLPQFISSVKNTNSLEKLLNKKHHTFLNTSNLFTPSIYSRERKSLNPNTKIETFIKKTEKGQYQPKYNHLYQYNKINSFNYKSDLGNSLMEFDEVKHVKTVPQQVEQTSSSSKHFKSKTKGELYKLIMHSPDKLRKSMKAKQHTEEIPRNQLMFPSPSKLSPSKANQRLCSQRWEANFKCQRPSRKFPKSLKFPQTDPTFRQKEEISGWAIEQDY